MIALLLTPAIPRSPYGGRHVPCRRFANPIGAGKRDKEGGHDEHQKSLAFHFKQDYKDPMRVFFAIALVIGAVSSSFGQLNVPDQEYRCPISQVCKTPHPLRSFEQHYSQEQEQQGKGYPFTVNYVEFKDSGDLWNPTELEDAVAQVRGAVGKNGENSVLLVVYIHGWENTADYVPGQCQDVCKFNSNLMTRLAQEQMKAAKPLTVIGVYLAWRGLASNVEPFKHFFTYWPRRNTARHVGLSGMYAAISQIEDAAQSNRSKYIIVFAGHSFGARVLENAAESKDKHHPGFMKAYRTQVKQQAQQPPGQFSPRFARNPDLPADLIFFVNAATSSTMTRETLKDIKATCKIEPTNRICDANPLYLAVTLHADLATGIIMPIANLVGPAPSDHLRLISAANSPSLHTHEDPIPGCDASASVCFGVGANLKTIKSIHPIVGRRRLMDRTRILSGYSMWIATSCPTTEMSGIHPSLTS